MTIKAYFDITWQGPVMDASGSKPTKEVKGKQFFITPYHL